MYLQLPYLLAVHNGDCVTGRDYYPEFCGVTLRNHCIETARLARTIGRPWQLVESQPHCTIALINRMVAGIDVKVSCVQVPTLACMLGRFEADAATWNRAFVTAVRFETYRDRSPVRNFHAGTAMRDAIDGIIEKYEGGEVLPPLHVVEENDS